jgi:hypothetical protein
MARSKSLDSRIAFTEGLSGSRMHRMMRLVESRAQSGEARLRQGLAVSPGKTPIREWFSLFRRTRLNFCHYHK